ncbi:MAG: universal stress protein [Pirellulales bacterium]|nr:universal stress protein [Pirellulales bacterium]
MTGFKNILVGIDTEQPDPGTLNQAKAIARRYDAKIKLLDTVPEFSWLSKAFTPRHKDLLELLIQEQRERLDAIAVEIGSEGFDVSVRCQAGRQSAALIQEATEGGHDLVMRVAKGRFSRRSGSMGTSAMKLLRRCPCALWLTKPGQTEPAERVMAAVDATPEDEDHGKLNFRILQLASEVCVKKEDLHAVYVWEVFGESIFKAKMPEDEFQTLEQEFRERNATSFNRVLEPHGLSLESPNVAMHHGDPVNVIPQSLASNSIDLLVMGTVAREGIPGMLLGNTAEALVDKIKCGLLTIHPGVLDSSSAAG